MKEEKNLKISDLKVEDKVRIKDNFFHSHMSDNLLKLKGKAFTIIDLNPKEATNQNCVKLNETGEVNKSRCWHVDWLILIEKRGSLEIDFVNKIIEYLKGGKNDNTESKG